MCPDRQIISLYCDDELPSPWKEKAETHINSCSDCRAKLEAYRSLRSDMCKDYPVFNNTFADTGDRVWAGLMQKIPSKQTALYTAKRGGNEHKRYFNHKIYLPFPVAAAAAAILIITAILAIRGLNKPVEQKYIDLMAGIESERQEVFPDSDDLSEIIRYLASRESSDYLIIQLPDSRNFTNLGEPALIRAADYSRRNTPR